MGYYYCKICGNVVYCNDNNAASLTCCGEKMNKCTEHISDSEMSEKHIPIYKIDGNKISIEVGEILHPYTIDHHIVFVELNTDKGRHIRMLSNSEVPKCDFYLSENEIPVNIRVYCNIHGLWRRDIECKNV